MEANVQITDHTREELEAMLQSEGWKVFRELVLKMYGGEAAINEIRGLVGGEKDHTTVGRQTAVVISTLVAVENILELPRVWIDQVQKERKR